MPRSTTDGGDDEDRDYPTAAWRDELGLPADRPLDPLDVRELPPPEPLQATLERVADLDGEILVQLNDREPKFLYPKLDDRGFEYRTETVDGTVLTAIWQ